MSKETTDSLNLSDEVKRISEGLQKGLKVGDDGIIAADKELFKGLLPEDISLETLKRVQQFSSDFYAGAVHATGTLGEAYLKKHKNVDKVSLEKLALGKDSVRIQYDRQTEVSSPRTGPVAKHGWLTGKYTAAASSNGAAQVGRIRSHFAELGAELFGGEKKADKAA